MHLEAFTKQSKVIFPRLAEFSDEFYLAGGTALALQIGHRVSVDFDFFSERQIEKPLGSKIKRIFSDFSLSTLVNNPDELTVVVGETKITFLHYPFQLLLDLISYEGARMLTVKEIAVTKAYTIGRRGSYKDYIDLYFVFLENYATLAEVIALAEKKYGNEFNGRLFLEQLVYLADVEDTAIELLRGGPLDPSALESFFVSEIKKFTL